MRALTELLTVFVAAFLGFFALVASLIGTIVGFLVIAVAGFFSAVSLLIALFAGAGFAFTGSHHDAGLAVRYSLYAAGSFAVMVVILFYRDKLRQTVRTRRALQGVRGLQLAAVDASFEPGIVHR